MFIGHVAGACVGLEIRTAGDTVVISDGADHDAAVPNEISYGGTDYVGISSFHIVEKSDGLRVAQHYLVGTF
jgi:hypothetical protein